MIQKSYGTSASPGCYGVCHRVYQGDSADASYNGKRRYRGHAQLQKKESQSFSSESDPSESSLDSGSSDQERMGLSSLVEPRFSSSAELPDAD